MKCETLELSAPSLRYAVEMCEANPQYCAVVVCKTQLETVTAFDTLTDYVDMTQYSKIAQYPNGSMLVEWKNKSYVQLIDIKDASKRCQSMLLLLSPTLDAKELKRMGIKK